MENTEIINREDIKDIPKKEKSNTGFVLALIIVLVLGMFGGAYFYATGFSIADMFPDSHDDDDTIIKYENHTFVKQDGLWTVFVGSDDGKAKFKVSLHYNPNELSNITILNESLDEFIESNEIYIAMDPKQEYKNTTYFVLASAEISRNLVSVFNKVPVGACYVNDDPEICFERPIIDCNENSTIPIVFINESQENYIEYITPNCAVINGHDEGIVKGAERLLYSWLGIME